MLSQRAGLQLGRSMGWAGTKTWSVSYRVQSILALLFHHTLYFYSCVPLTSLLLLVIPISSFLSQASLKPISNLILIIFPFHEIFNVNRFSYIIPCCFIFFSHSKVYNIVSMHKDITFLICKTFRWHGVRQTNKVFSKTWFLVSLEYLLQNFLSLWELL